jgi:hypothetical protein
MSKKQKEIEKAVKDVRAGTRTFTEDEIAALKRTVAGQRGRRKSLTQASVALPAVTDYGRSRRGTVALGRRVPGNFESKK